MQYGSIRLNMCMSSINSSACHTFFVICSSSIFKFYIFNARHGSIRPTFEGPARALSASEAERRAHPSEEIGANGRSQDVDGYTPWCSVRGERFIFTTQKPAARGKCSVEVCMLHGMWELRVRRFHMQSEDERASMKLGI